MYGTDYNYASSRLAGTVVRLKDGTPVIVDDVHPRMKVTVVALEKLDELIEVNLDDLNLKPVPLGMCNWNGQTTYLCRKPMRRDWKQGLRAGNFTSLFGFPAEVIPPGTLSEVIKGIYPTFKEALEKFKDKKVMSVAWSREWAVDRHGVLTHKGNQQVGQIVDGNCVLFEQFQHLRESYLESV